MSATIVNKLFVKLVEDDQNAKKVIVTPYALLLKEGSICWEKDPDSPINFNFINLVFESEVFTNIDISAERICADHNANLDDYRYDLWVEEVETGQIYKTNYLYTPVPQDVTGRPVIRPR